MNPGRESEKVKFIEKIKGRERARQSKVSSEGEQERNQQAKSRQQVLLRARGRETPLLLVTCPRRVQSVFNFPLLFGYYAQKVCSREHKVSFLYQDLQQTPSKHMSALNSGRENEKVRKSRTENEARRMKENKAREQERNQQAK